MVSLLLLPKVAFWVTLFGVKESCMAGLLCHTHSAVAPNELTAGSVSVSHRVISRVPLLLKLREDEDKNYVYELKATFKHKQTSGRN